MKIKKIVAAFMAAATVCGSVVVTAGAEEMRSFTAESYNGASVKSDRSYEGGCDYNGCYFNYSDNEYCFVRDYNSVSDSMKELSIPAEIDGIPVTGIRVDVPMLNRYDPFSELEKLYIPSSIKSIYQSRDREEVYPLIYVFPNLTDVYFEGTEEEWYSAQSSIEYYYKIELGLKWDGKFSKDSNLAFDGIENITLHVNCKSIDDEGTIVNFNAKAEKPAKVSGIKRSGSKTYIKLSWNESKNAESYVIKYSTDKKTWKPKTVKANSVKLTKLKAGTKYYIKIAAKNSAGTSAYSKVFSVTTKK